MSGSSDVAGYIFVGNSDYNWYASKAAVPGKEDYWTRVPAGSVQVGKPVWILQCGADVDRGFYAVAETVSPRHPRTDLAWLRYERRYDPPILLPSSPSAAPAGLRASQWQDNRLPILFGIKPGNGGVVRPCGFVGTVFPVGTLDSRKIAQLFPTL